MQLVCTLLIYCKGNTIHRERRSFLCFFFEKLLYRKCFVSLSPYFLIITAVLSVKKVSHFLFYSLRRYPVGSVLCFRIDLVVLVFFCKGNFVVLRTTRSSGKLLGQQSPHFHFITGSILALNLLVLAPYLFVASKRKRPTLWKDA